MSLDNFEFIFRFTLHLLPKGLPVSDITVYWVANGEIDCFPVRSHSHLSIGKISGNPKYKKLINITITALANYYISEPYLLLMVHLALSPRLHPSTRIITGEDSDLGIASRLNPYLLSVVFLQWVIGRKPFGYIDIANSDSAISATTKAVISQAQRAVTEFIV